MPKALMKKVPISEEEFLRKIEKMYGEYAIEEIACHMKSDFRYNSFWVLEEMKSAARYVDYITTYAVQGSPAWYCGSLTRNRYA